MQWREKYVNLFCDLRMTVVTKNVITYGNLVIYVETQFSPIGIPNLNSFYFIKNA